MQRIIMTREERIARLRATRVPKVVLRRAEDVFPSLKTSTRFCVPEDAEVTSIHQTVRMSEPQNGYVIPEEYENDAQYLGDVDNNSVTEDTGARKRRPGCSYVCRKSFIRQSNLIRHLRIHTGVRPYSCDVCNSFSNWRIIKHGVPQCSIVGPLLFLLYINDLSKSINRKAKPILFADDTSIIFTNSNPRNLKNDVKSTFGILNKWFTVNRLLLNYDKTHFIQFTTKYSPQIDLTISYENKLITKVYDTKFLGIYVDSALSWKIHIEQTVHKLSAACYAMRSMKPFMKICIVHYAYLHSIMNYGIIFWGNSSHSKKNFHNTKENNHNYCRMQKQRLM